MACGASVTISFVAGNRCPSTFMVVVIVAEAERVRQGRLVPKREIKVADQAGKKKRP